MKRSASLRLVLMGGAALTLAGCEEPVEVGVFETVQQCTVMGYSESACETAIAAASREHLQSAPRYASRADCEAEFGTCESATAAASDTPPSQTQGPDQQAAQSSMGSFFMPLMAGYMMGQMMGGRSAMAQPLYRPMGDAARQAGGTGFYTGAGTKVATQTGLARVPQAALTSTRASGTTLARGGFGARARSVSVAS